MSKKEVIVIADDDPTIRKVMKAALEKGGFEVVDVDNGAMACAAFAQHSPSIVLLDVEMPVQDGFSACAQIRRLPGGAFGLVVLSPLRPIELLLRGRRQLRRGRVGRRHAVFQARPHAHHREAGEDAVAKDFSLRRLGVKLDSDIQPAVGDELENVSLLGALAGGFDDDYPDCSRPPLLADQRPGLCRHTHYVDFRMGWRTGGRRRA